MTLPLSPHRCRSPGLHPSAFASDELEVVITRTADANNGNYADDHADIGLFLRLFRLDRLSVRLFGRRLWNNAGAFAHGSLANRAFHINITDNKVCSLLGSNLHVDHFSLAFTKPPHHKSSPYKT